MNLHAIYGPSGWRIKAGRGPKLLMPETVIDDYLCADCTDGREGGLLILRWQKLYSHDSGRWPLIRCADCGKSNIGAIYAQVRVVHKTAAANAYVRAEIKRMEATPPVIPGDDLSVTRFAESETDDWM